MARVSVVHGEALGSYGFPGHPFGTDRLAAFWTEAVRQGLDRRIVSIAPDQATSEQMERFHTPEYVALVQELSRVGSGLLDAGDTPAFPGCYEATATVVGSGLCLLSEVLEGRVDRGLLPIGGLHHARRDRAGGFCIFNDCGVLIETLRRRYGIERVLYVDIDAHHGDGVYYGFAADPNVVIVDVHEDGRFLYPGTGHFEEQGEGSAHGTKLNLPLRPGATDEAFLELWQPAEAFLEAARPDIVLLQCGADCLRGDPLTHLCLSRQIHERVARFLVGLSQRHAQGRLIAFGGGGYDLGNLAQAWTTVLRTLIED